MSKGVRQDSRGASKKVLTEENLANVVVAPEVFLRTMQVKIMSQGKERVIRALVDTGSQRFLCV